MDLTEEQVKAVIKTICPVCAITRSIVKIPRDPARRRATNTGELIHVDRDVESDFHSVFRVRVQ